MIPMPSTPQPSRLHGSAGLTQRVYSRRHRPATAKANGTISSVKPTNSVGGWITIQGFWSKSLRPCPSAGTKPVWSAGASGNLSASVWNGLAPTSSGPSCRPTIIDSMNAWHSATTAIAGAPKSRAWSPTAPSVRPLHRASTAPTAAVIMAHSRNEPSWPAQNDENV